MKHGVTYLILILLTLATVQAQPSPQCPELTNKGTDFWFMYLYNMNINSGSWTSHRSLIVAGDQSATIQVEGPSGATSTFTVPGGSYDDTHEYGTNVLTVATPYNGGYHITSSQPVFAYTRNYVESTHDVATLLPTYTLDTHYIVQDYPSQQYGGEVGFVATEDNTVLTMTVPCDIANTSIAAGTTLTPTLMQGQAYMLLGEGSLAGMEVTSNGKPFAMFQGGWNPSVPENVGGRDHIYEQALPVKYWGTEFIVMSSAEQSVNQIRITSSEDGCVVTSNGISLGTLGAGQTMTQTCLANASYAISASKPVMVVLYLGSYTAGGNTGDPASVIIPPLDRGVCESRFVLHNTPLLTTHRLCVVCDTAYCNGLTLDGNPVPPSTTVVDGHRLYRLVVTGGGHTLQNSVGPFVAYAYGIGHYEGYAFPLGFGLGLELVHDTVECHDTVCQYESFEGCGFSIDSGETATAGALERWRQAVGNDTVHHYHLSLVVRSVADSVVESQIARGDTLFFHGDTLTAAGNYLYSLTAANGCDSIVRLHLIYSMDTIEYYDTVCQGQAYSGYGFNITTTQTAGTRAYWDDWGDSLYRYCLWLTVLPISYTDTTVYVFMGDTVFHNGDTLVDTGAYTTIYTAANGCDSVFTLHLRYEEMRLEASADGICPGDSVTLTATGTHTAWWVSTPPDETLAGQQEMTTIVVRPQQSTTYCLFSREGGEMIGCIDVGVEAPPELCVQLSIPIIDFDYPVVHFNDCSESGVVSNWTFSEYGISAGEDVTVSQRKVIRKFQHPLPDSVVVTLQSCNQYHCCADTVFCVPTKIRSVWWPNVFTPGEEQNNRFGCVTSIDIAEYELFIYNRLGLQVFHSADPTAAWDGTCEGVPVQQGAYVYRWYIRDVYGSLKNGVGTVTLIR